MALSSATITFDLADLLGVDFDARRTRVWVSTNIPNETVIDTAGNQIRLGSGKAVVDSNGTGSFSVWVPGTGSNPASWQTYVHVDYVDSGDHRKGRRTRTFGPFTITVNADLADLVQQAVTPPEILGGDAYMATIDADGSSLYRQQQDTRLSATIATEVTPIRGTVAALQFPGFRSLRTALDAGESCAVQVLSDSTGNESWEWPHLVAQSLATEYPGHRVEWRYWTDAAQDIAISNLDVIQNPGARYMSMVNGNNARRLPNGYSPHLTGTIDVRVKVNMADWTPGNPFGAEILVGEAGGTDAWGWSFAVNSGGVLRMYYSVDGTTLGSISANAVHDIADGSTQWIRCVFTPNDGAGNRVAKFYKLVGSTWTQIGTTVTTAGAVTLADRIAAGDTYMLGNPGAAGNTTAVSIYEVEVRDGENGPDVVPRLPDVWAQFGAGTTHPMVGPPVLVVVAGAHPGATISYLDDATRKKRLTPDFGQVVTFLSCSHNQTRNVGRAWYAQFAAWVASVQARMGTPVIAVTQNPQKGAAVYKAEHARRRLDLLGFAKGLGVDTIDTYAHFIADPSWETALMGDDVHPNAAGQQVWADAVMAAFDTTA